MVSPKQKPIVDIEEIKKKESKHITIKKSSTHKDCKRERKTLKISQKTIRHQD